MESSCSLTLSTRWTSPCRSTSGPPPHHFVGLLPACLPACPVCAHHVLCVLTIPPTATLRLPVLLPASLSSQGHQGCCTCRAVRTHRLCHRYPGLPLGGRHPGSCDQILLHDLRPRALRCAHAALHLVPGLDQADRHQRRGLKAQRHAGGTTAPFRCFSVGSRCHLSQTLFMLQHMLRESWVVCRPR